MWNFKKYEYVVGYEILSTNKYIFLENFRNTGGRNIKVRIALDLNVAYLAFNESWIKLPLTNIMLD